MKWLKSFEEENACLQKLLGEAMLDENLVIGDDVEDGTGNGKRMAFVWDSGKRRYKRALEKDKSITDYCK